MLLILCPFVLIAQSMDAQQTSGNSTESSTFNETSALDINQSKGKKNTMETITENEYQDRIQARRMEGIKANILKQLGEWTVIWLVTDYTTYK